MAVSYTTRLNLPKQDIGETGWGVTLNTGLQDADDRFFLSGAGDPNGVATSQYVGQRYWDTTNEVWYTATASGVDDAWALEIGTQYDNNTYLQWRNAGDSAWRDMIGISAGDVAIVGAAAHNLTLRGNSFASLLALMGGVSRRIIVADASDNNDADLLTGVVGSLVSGGSGVTSTWKSYLKLPIVIGSDQVVLNFGHNLAVPNSSLAVAYSYTFQTACYVTGCCQSNATSTISNTNCGGARCAPQPGNELVNINIRIANSTGGSGGVFWWALGA